MSNGTAELSPEVRAMAQVEEVLEALDEEPRGRVLRWLAERFRPKAGGLGGTGVQGGLEQTGVLQGEYKELSDFYAAARPETEAERALVVGYWFQFVKGEGEFDAQRINGQLKNLGHRVKNITQAFNTLMAERPQLVVQTRKSGTSKQARKRYKLTLEGKNRVDEMIRAIKETE